MLGRTVPEHCQIVGEVARELVGRYPPALRDSLFPAHAPFAAACHDIGKVSPSFVEKLRRALHQRHGAHSQASDFTPSLKSNGVAMRA
jgi:HD superfamily phosphohydrolase YqeK